MWGYLYRAFLALSGAFFTALGVAGLFLPVLQGVLFIAIGIVLLSLASGRFRSWVERHTRRYPRLHAAIARVREKIERLVGDEHES